MQISDSVKPTDKLWWIVGVGLLTGMIPIGAVLYKAAPTSWYWSDLNEDVKILIAVLVFLILIWAVVVYFSLKSRIIIHGDKHTIKARIQPFMRKNREVILDEVQDLRIRKFNAIGNFGGMGYRKTSGKTTAYVLSLEGIALEMKLKNGKTFNVEITKEAEWKKYLEQIKLQNLA